MKKHKMRGGQSRNSNNSQSRLLPSDQIRAVRANTRPRSSEVDAYVHIKSELKILGWDTGNPARVPQGQVYTQNECLSHPEIKVRLGKDRPENIVKLGEREFWVIEGKRTRPELNKALNEAKEYANAINGSPAIKARIASGVAGNETDGYSIRTQFLEIDGRFDTVTLNGQEVTGLLSPQMAARLLETGSARLQDIPIDLKFFLGKAERINEILHEGAIPIKNRASVISALLLSFLDDSPLSLDSAASVLIGDINNRVRRVLKKQGKPDFYQHIRISLPTTEENHTKFRKAIVEAYSELESMSIRTAMNSGTDVLGQFYEVFLKYGKGAKEMGIVLTPRHITRFAADALGIGINDIVLDPTVGTGGFLVGAFDSLKQNASPNQLEHFKRNNVFGMDQEPEVASLAIVNMIFRGDGKNNIIDANCFYKALVKHTENGEVTAKYIGIDERKPTDENAVTRVLMNPSFKQESTDEPEYKFVKYALTQMVDGGLLFSILPISAMYEQGEEREWRENQLLKTNTLLAVVTLPPELFYPVASVHTVGIFVKKGIPHPPNQNVLWMRAIHDGHIIKKSRRLPDDKEANDLKDMLPTLKAFTQNPSFPVPSISEFRKTAQINYRDKSLELIPEAYLDAKQPTIDDLKEGVETLTRETVTYLIRTKQEGAFLN